MREYIAAIDQGTTSTRFLIFDHSGKTVAAAQKEHEQIYPAPGWVEHNPETIWQNTQYVIAQALADSGLRASDLAAIGITNQRETTVMWDRSTGRAMANAIVWQDTRTASLVSQSSRNGGQDRFRAKTGGSALLQNHRCFVAVAQNDCLLSRNRFCGLQYIVDSVN